MKRLRPDFSFLFLVVDLDFCKLMLCHVWSSILLHNLLVASENSTGAEQETTTGADFQLSLFLSSKVILKPLQPHSNTSDV